MDSLWNRHDESIDSTTLKNLSMRISECSYACFVVIASNDEVHFGCCSRVSSIARENEHLIVVLVVLSIVHHGCDSELA